MTFLNFIFFCAFSFISDAENFSEEIIKFGLSHYKSRSVILLDSNLSYSSEVKKLMTSSNELYLVSLMSFSNFEKSFTAKYQGGKPMVVVFDYGGGFIHILNRLSHAGAVSSYKWLLTTQKFNMEDFRRVEIPLNSEVIVAEGEPLSGYNLVEIYETTPGIKSYNVLGDFTKGSQNLKISDLFERRKNLKGAVIKVVSPSKDPCSERSFTEGIASIVYCIHNIIWNVFTEMLNATAEMIIERNLTVDTLLDTGAELTFRSFPLNPTDVKTRSFLWPVFHTKTEIVTSYIEQKVEWRTYIRPFSKEMWLGILIWIVFCDLAVLLGEIFTRSGSYEGAILAYWSKYSFASFFAFCDQSASDAPKFISYRIIFLVMFLVPSVLLPGYSAIVTSYLTVPLRKMPFRNLEELSQTENYDLGWHRSFPMEYLFNVNNSSPVNQALLKNNVLTQAKLPATDTEGVERMCTRKFAFLTTMDTILALKPKCNYFKLKEYFRIVFTTMEMKKNSWYEQFLNRCERTLDYTGTLYRISLQTVMKYIRYHETLVLNMDEAQPILMENIILPFVVMVVGVFSSVVLLLFEIAYFKTSRRYRTVRREGFTRRERMVMKGNERKAEAW